MRVCVCLKELAIFMHALVLGVEVLYELFVVVVLC